MQYLTVQDFVWINHKATRKVHRFEYSRLEDGVYFQYGYVNSKNLFEQATALINGFAAKEPFADGNLATAFIGFVAFLACNGAVFSVSDDLALNWLSQFRAKPSPVALAEACAVDTHNEGHGVEVAKAIEDAVTKFPVTIAALLVSETENRRSSFRDVEILNTR